MNDDKTSKKHKYWLHQLRFCITESLRERIKDLPEKDQIKYCYVQHFVIKFTKDNPHEFRQIGRSLWKSRLGSEYTKIRQQLEDWKEIELLHSYDEETKEFYKPYSNGGLGSLCYQYKLGDNSINSPLVKMSFKKKRQVKHKDKSDLTTNPKLEIMVKSGLSTTISDKLDMEHEDPLTWSTMTEYADKIMNGKFDFHKGKKVDRCYSSFTQCPKIIINNLVLKDNPQEPLFLYDCKTAVPFMLLSLLKTDYKKGDRYKEFLKYRRLLTEEKDFYTSISIQTHSGYIPRDDIKVMFMEFLCGKSKNFFYDYFEKEFPILFEYIETNKKEISSWYQNLESSIFVTDPLEYISNKLKQKKYMDTFIYFISRHDSWICREKDSDIIMRRIRSVFKEKVGIYPIFTKTNLLTGEVEKNVGGRNYNNQSTTNPSICVGGEGETYDFIEILRDRIVKNPPTDKPKVVSEKDKLRRRGFAIKRDIKDIENYLDEFSDIITTEDREHYQNTLIWKTDQMNTAFRRMKELK